MKAVQANVKESQPKWNFAFDDFLRREYRFGLDPNRPTCKAFLQGHCPQGSNCPDKHPASSSYNKSASLLTEILVVCTDLTSATQSDLQALAPRPL